MKINITGIALISIGIMLIGVSEFNRETGKRSFNLSPDRIKTNIETSMPYPWLAFFGLTLIVGGIIVIEPEKNSVLKKSLPALQEFTFRTKGIKQPRHKTAPSRVLYFRNKLIKRITRPIRIND